MEQERSLAIDRVLRLDHGVLWAPYWEANWQDICDLPRAIQNEKIEPILNTAMEGFNVPLAINLIRAMNTAYSSVIR